MLGMARDHRVDVPRRTRLLLVARPTILMPRRTRTGRQRHGRHPGSRSPRRPRFGNHPEPNGCPWSGRGWHLDGRWPIPHRRNPVRRRGQTAQRLLEYKLQTIADAPKITTQFVEIFTDNAGPRGAKGLAEAPNVATCGAVNNAIGNATGVRMYQLPMTAERVWEQLNSPEQTASGQNGESS